MSADGLSGGLERTLSREYYLSAEVFARERERIFCREWFCVGREEELAGPGDYVVKDVAGESILVVRTQGGGLAGHYNVCRHRGSQLVPEGGAGSFGGGIRCPYHSWTYTLEGELRTAPFLRGVRRARRPDGDALAASGRRRLLGRVRLRPPDAGGGRGAGPHARRASSAPCPSGSGATRSPSSAWRGASCTRSRPTGR